MMNVLRLLSVVIFYLCCLSIAAYASGNLSEKVRQALSEGHLAEVGNLLQQVKNNPRAYQAWFLLGVSPSKIQCYHPAIESFHPSWMLGKKIGYQLDSEAYLKDYDQNFYSGHWNLALWNMHKQRVNASKSFVDVAISHVTMIHDPNVWAEGDVIVTDFEQRYQSDNYQDVTHKRMYWVRKKTSDAWNILIEETL
ncbi:MAG: hypothetical protein Q9M11_06660 [Mariprofundaceae bacterium]|nr:hypothetical protein [Mariprofundaceae bacterium]